MASSRPRRLAALAATVTLLVAQPAVLCGLLCVATHTSAAPIAEHHHESPDAPCGGGQVTATDGIRLELQAAGAALQTVAVCSVAVPEPHHAPSVSPPAHSPVPLLDLRDPPPRA